MAVIPLGTDDWESASENIQRIRLHNMYLINNPASPDGVSRVSRPTLKLLTEIGEGPIQGIWRQDNTFDGDWMVVSGTALYRYDPVTNVTVSVGAIPGDEICQFAGTDSRLLIAREGVLYSTDGSSVTTVVIPDNQPVESVATINSYFLLSIQGSQRYYWIEPGETDPDPLSFASAERIPDAIASINIVSDEIWFLGTSGPEVWTATGDNDAPFQRISGRVYSDGCLSKASTVPAVFNNAPCLIWVTQTRSVVLAQGSVNKISTESVEELLKDATNIRAWTFRQNRHDFFVLTADEFTLAFNLTKPGWSRWDNYGSLNFRGHLGLMQQQVPYAGDKEDGRIWRLEEGVQDDVGARIMEVTGLVSNMGPPIPCAEVSVRVNAGWSPSYGFEPLLELRWSDDQGATWSDYIQLSLGDKGSYNKETVFKSLGIIQRPGRNFEFRFSAPARFRLDYAAMNEE